MNARERTTGESTESFNPVQPPAISLPTGGAAIRGIGEKFTANPVNGTCSFAVPFATSPGRSGFRPQLELSYDSGAGNGPFGFGWRISIPSITRKTDRGLPRYDDTADSDEFVLSGTEELVPVPEAVPNQDGYRIRRYRPRIDGLFARIERWTNIAHPGAVHWRSISKDNVLSVYGKDGNSRIADPMATHRIFSWLICETRDDKGNGSVHDYKLENGVGVDLDQNHEWSRGIRDVVERTANPKTLRRHANDKGMNFQGLQIISDPFPKPQGLALEQDIGTSVFDPLAKELGSLYKLGGNYDPSDVFIPQTKIPTYTLLNPAIYGPKTKK